MKSSKNVIHDTNLLSDKESDISLNEIEALLVEDHAEQPNKAIDKQILAFSYRELKEEKENAVAKKAKAKESRFVGTLNTSQWWRRFALPSFIASGFVMTVLAFQALWQPLFDHQIVYKEQALNADLSVKQQIEQPLVEIGTDGSINQTVKKSTSQLMRENANQKVLAEFKENQKIPNLDPRYTESDSDLGRMKSETIVAKGFISDELSDVATEKEEGFAQNLESQNIFTGSELVKSDFQEKEAWAKNIIQLVKEKEFEKVETELERFKKVYPKFPIEEQINLLNN